MKERSDEINRQTLYYKNPCLFRVLEIIFGLVTGTGRCSVTFIESMKERSILS